MKIQLFRNTTRRWRNASCLKKGKVCNEMKILCSYLDNVTLEIYVWPLPFEDEIYENGCD